MCSLDLEGESSPPESERFGLTGEQKSSSNGQGVGPDILWTSGAQFKNEKAAQRETFWAVHPVDVLVDIRVDVCGQKLSPLLSEPPRERRKVKFFARTSLTQ